MTELSKELAGILEKVLGRCPLTESQENNTNLTPSSQQELNKRVNDTSKLMDQLEGMINDLVHLEIRVANSREEKARASEEKAKAAQHLALAQSLEAKYRQKFEAKQEEGRVFEEQQSLRKKEMIAAYNTKIEQIKKDFDQSIKHKDEQIKKSEQLKQECTKQQTTAITNEAIKEAQFKKKQLEGYLEEATLKQRLEIMDKYREINLEMCGKINQSRQEKKLIKARAGVLEQYDHKYKEAMDEFHRNLDTYKVEFEHYKKNIQKTQKKINSLESRLKGNEGTLQTMKADEHSLQGQINDLQEQIKILLKITSDLQAHD